MNVANANTRSSTGDACVWMASRMAVSTRRVSPSATSRPRIAATAAHAATDAVTTVAREGR